MTTNENKDTAFNIEVLLEDIHLITIRLRKLGMISFLFTIISFAIVLLFSIQTMQRYYYYLFHLPTEFYALFFIFIIFFGMYTLIIYDRMRKKGDALFEEVSDELQWNILQSVKTEKVSDRSKKPTLKARVVLREFITTIDLPLVRGKHGMTIYFLINIVSILLFVFTNVRTIR